MRLLSTPVAERVKVGMPSPVSECENVFYTYRYSIVGIEGEGGDVITCS